jgi:hypothetical protein
MRGSKQQRAPAKIARVVSGLARAARANEPMRRILLDEGVPIGVRTLVAGFHVEAVPEIGWAGLSNGDLIQAVEEAGFEVMICNSVVP